MRGFDACTAVRIRALRFIPACAGFCACRRANASDVGVHPRVCGVLDALSRLALICEGSSPRVRGFVVPAYFNALYIRFIPACAGFWSVSSLFFRAYKVHPRVCGVLRQGMASIMNHEGSSPRVRGFAFLGGDCAWALGFIPACAGFCREQVERWEGLMVHPRVCGVLRSW